jgi:hypothetical protein
MAQDPQQRTLQHVWHLWRTASQTSASTVVPWTSLLHAAAAMRAAKLNIMYEALWT